MGTKTLRWTCTIACGVRTVYIKLSGGRAYALDA